MEIIDYIIVGSGCTGAMAAETLCLSGKKVLMLDAGIAGKVDLPGNDDFVQKRLADHHQADFFLGKELEALAEATHPNIPQQTAQRKFMSDDTDKFIPVNSDNFFPVESLALGGLGNGWGLGSYIFSDTELKKCGLLPAEMKEAYQVIAGRVGISGEVRDDASNYCHNNEINLQPSLTLNPSAGNLYRKYQQKKANFHAKGMFMGRPSLALLTKNKDHRKAYTYRDLEFYGNEGSAAYRPYITIKELVKQGKLEYQSNWLAISFKEKSDHTALDCINTKTNERKTFHAAKLVLATGTLGTSRIVMRSFQQKDKLPVLCNAYTYMPMVHWPFIGKKNTGKFCGLAQLAMFYDKDNSHANVAMASIYNYRSLLNFRILKQMPLNHADGMKFLQLIVPALFVAGIFHPADYQEQNFIQLQQSSTSITGDVLHTDYTYTGNELKDITATEKTYAKAFSQLSCLILKKMRTATGASIHYAGTLPFSKEERPYHISPDGKLHGTNNVYVADGSGFTFLPGKGLTLSLMANAHLVAQKLIQHG